nr:ADP-ribosylglycohydrolase family protein [Kitasatospora sp. MMS16-BH015]
MDRGERAVGAVVGSAVGDALGAPFEFGPAGQYSARFPDGHGEPAGGGGWDPGEATDDTQMAVLVGQSLVECGGLDPADLFARFRQWAAAEPKDPADRPARPRAQLTKPVTTSLRSTWGSAARSSVKRASRSVT